MLSITQPFSAVDKLCTGGSKGVNRVVSHPPHFWVIFFFFNLFTSKGFPIDM